MVGQDGAFYRLAQQVPAADNTLLRITGFGVDGDPPGSCYPNNLSGTQQTDTGEYVAKASNEVRHTVDTTGGNSGSAIEHDCRGVVYAIHAQGGCPTVGYNVGTSVTNRFLEGALADPRGICADCAGTDPDCNGNGILDQCEPQEDCQPNGTQDICDIASGASQDIDGNQIPDECEASVGGCCMSGGSCVAMAETCCTEAGGTFGGEGFGCEVGACCLGDGTCKVLTEACCRAGGGSFQGTGTDCSPERACCLPDGSCVDTTQSCCQQQGGAYFGTFTCLTIPECGAQYGPVGP